MFDYKKMSYEMGGNFAWIGYATEAARALLRWAFEEVGFHRVYGRTEPRNEASGLARPQREPSAAGWVRKGLGPSSALEAPLP